VRAALASPNQHSAPLPTVGGRACRSVRALAGRKVRGTLALTPALSPGERESHRQRALQFTRSWKAQFRFRACIGTMNLDERTDPSPRPSPHRKGRGRRIGSARRNWPGSWRAYFRFGACLGTMNLDERTDSSPRPSPLPKGRGRRIGSARRNWPGSWKARFRFCACIGPMNLGTRERTPHPDPLPFGRGEGEGSAARVAIGPVHGEPTFAFCACIGTMNRDERTDPSPRPSPLPKGRGRSLACARGSLVGSWRAHFRFAPCLGPRPTLRLPCPDGVS